MAALLVKLALYAAALGAAGLAFAVLTYLRSPPGEARKALRLAGLLAVAAVAVAGVRLAAETARLAGGWASIGEPPYFPWTLEALAPFLIPFLAGALLLAVFGVAGRAWLAALGALAMLAGFTAIGHTADESAPGLLRAALVVHLVGIATWVVAPVLLWPSRTLDDAALLARVRGFSRVAVGLIPVTLAAGVLLAAALLDTPADLIATPYGRLILVKASAASIAFGLGAVNTLWVAARIADDPARGRAALRLTLSADAVSFAVALTAIAAATTVFGL